MVRTLQSHCPEGSVKFLVGELKSHKPPSPAKKKKKECLMLHIYKIMYSGPGFFFLKCTPCFFLQGPLCWTSVWVLRWGRGRGWGADAACPGVPALCASPPTFLAKGVCLVSLLTSRLWILKNQLYWYAVHIYPFKVNKWKFLVRSQGATTTTF